MPSNKRFYEAKFKQNKKFDFDIHFCSDLSCSSNPLTETEQRECAVTAVAAGVENICKQKKKKKTKKKRGKVKDRFMELWNKMIFPVRRVWVSVSSRVKARKNGAGILMLRDDVQTCEYQDVQVMWEMLSRSESELLSHIPKRRQRPFWRVFVWSNNHSPASSFSAKHT